MSLFDKIQKTFERMDSKMPIGKKEPIKEMTIRDMKRRMYRKDVQEEAAVAPNNTQPSQRQVLPHEMKKYEERMLNYFKDDNVNIEFSELLVFDEGIFWGGTIDGQVQFSYVVAPDEAASGVQINYLPGFNKNDPDNESVVNKLEAYYDEFYKYWRENELNIDNRG